VVLKLKPPTNTKGVVLKLKPPTNTKEVMLKLKPLDVAHGIGDTAPIHFKISMRLLIFIEVRPIIYQKLQNFANINNLMLK